MNENDAKTLIERFAEKQQDGRFACPRCGKMAMDADRMGYRLRAGELAHEAALLRRSVGA